MAVGPPVGIKVAVLDNPNLGTLLFFGLQRRTREPGQGRFTRPLPAPVAQRRTAVGRQAGDPLE